MPAGVCKYTIHEDDVQWDVVKENWDQLSAKDKDRYSSLRHNMSCNIGGFQLHTCRASLLYVCSEHAQQAQHYAALHYLDHEQR